MSGPERGGTAVEVVRRGFAAADAGDLHTARELFAEDVAYHLLNLLPTHSRTWIGREAYFGLVGSLAEPTGGTYRYDVLDLLAAGDELVIVHGVTSATFDGREAPGLHWVLVARVVDGVIVQMVDTAETRLDEFWRPPKA